MVRFSNASCPWGIVACVSCPTSFRVMMYANSRRWYLHLGRLEVSFYNSVGKKEQSAGV